MLRHAAHASLLIIPGLEVQPDKILLLERSQQQRDSVYLLPGTLQPFRFQDPEQKVQILGYLRLEIGACLIRVEYRPRLEIAGRGIIRWRFVTSVRLEGPEEDGPRVVQSADVLDFQGLVYPAQLVQLRLIVVLAESDQTQESPVRLKVPPVVVLHRMFPDEAGEDLAGAAAGIGHGEPAAGLDDPLAQLADRLRLDLRAERSQQQQQGGVIVGGLLVVGMGHLVVGHRTRQDNADSRAHLCHRFVRPGTWTWLSRRSQIRPPILSFLYVVVGSREIARRFALALVRR